VNQIFRELKKLTSYQGEEIHGPAKLGEVRLSYLEASKAKAELGWEPTVSLEEGLRRTVEYFRPLVAPA
jgi:UDP-glucose 4-epimerase